MKASLSCLLTSSIFIFRAVGGEWSFKSREGTFLHRPKVHQLHLLQRATSLARYRCSTNKPGPGLLPVNSTFSFTRVTFGRPFGRAKEPSWDLQSATQRKSSKKEFMLLIKSHQHALHRCHSIERGQEKAPHKDIRKNMH